MQLFSADAIVFSKKLKKLILTPKTWKNRPQKLLIIGPQLFFMYWPGCPNGPETCNPVPQKPLNAGLGIQTGIVTQGKMRSCPVLQIVQFSLQKSNFDYSQSNPLILVQVAKTSCSTYLFLLSFLFSFPYIDKIGQKQSCWIGYYQKFLRMEALYVTRVSSKFLLTTLYTKLYLPVGQAVNSFGVTRQMYLAD